MKLKEISARVEIVLEYKGKVLLDYEGARLLESIDSYGSILIAARSLGLPYSKAWEKISRIEKLLGVKVVERRRGGSGGGGSALSAEGKALLTYYRRVLDSYGIGFGSPGMKKLEVKDVFVVSGSHDIVLEVILGELRRSQGFRIESHWTGSSGGLASLMLGDAVLASSHLYDPASGEYNIPFLKVVS